MPFSLLAAGAAFAYALMNWAKNITNKQWNAVVTQLLTWAVGWLVVVIMAHSDFADTVKVLGRPLDVLDGVTLFLIGVSFIGSIATVAYDAKKAIDNDDSAKTPPLLGG